MCDNLSKFSSEEDEDIVFNEDFVQVYKWLKNYYKELFSILNMQRRIKVYQFIYHCDEALKMKNREIGDKLSKELMDNFNL